MEAVQILQNPGTVVSGSLAPAPAGQPGSAGAAPAFEQMFSRALSTTAADAQTALESGLPVSTVRMVPSTERAVLPLAARIAVPAPSGNTDAVESITGETADASATAKCSAVSDAALQMTHMLVRIREKTEKAYGQKGVAAGEDSEKKDESLIAIHHAAVKIVTTESGNLNKGIGTIGSQADPVSADEVKPKGFSEGHGASRIPVVPPEFVAMAATAGESRATVSGELFTVPERSVFDAEVVSGRGSETPSLFHREGMPVVEQFAAEMGGRKSADAIRIVKTAEVGMVTKNAASGETARTIDRNIPGEISGPAPDRNGAERTLGRQFVDVTQQNADGVSSVKGETVLRQVPGGVTVVNPAQTVQSGASPVRAEMMTAMRAGNETEIRPVRETDTVETAVPEAVLGEADTEGMVKNVAYSSGEGSSRHTGGEGSEHRGLAAVISPSAPSESEAPGKGETEPIMERKEFHESILSQVREKLASPEAGNGAGRITLKLNPRELGDMHIHLRMEGAKVSVEITAQNQVVREALVQNLDQLKETLLRQNIAMERFDVTTGNGHTSHQSFREGRQASYPQRDETYYADAGSYQEEPGTTMVSYGEARENSLVDMRF